MKRRALLQSLAALAAFRPALAARLAAQADAEFTAARLRTLRAIAEAGLPTAVGEAERGRVVIAFVNWHRGYREGADRGHGYGSGRLSAPSGPAPATRYPPQFAALDAAAAAASASSSGSAGAAATFADAPIETRRAIITRALEEPRVANLPAAPNGNNLVADVLGFYFNSAAAWDLCYQAAIRRDSCRSLDGSDRPPARSGGAGAARS